MREIIPPNSESGDWEATDLDFVHVRKIGEQEVESFSSDKVLEHWIGTRRKYRNIKDHSVLYREYDFFIRGVVLKIWGFEEDLAKSKGQFALLDAGKWYLKEPDDDFDLIVKFTKENTVASVKIRFANKNRVIEVLKESLEI